MDQTHRGPARRTVGSLHCFLALGKKRGSVDRTASLCIVLNSKKGRNEVCKRPPNISWWEIGERYDITVGVTEDMKYTVERILFEARGECAGTWVCRWEEVKMTERPRSSLRAVRRLSKKKGSHPESRKGQWRAVAAHGVQRHGAMARQCSSTWIVGGTTHSFSGGERGGKEMRPASESGGRKGTQVAPHTSGAGRMPRGIKTAFDREDRGSDRRVHRDK